MRSSYLAIVRMLADAIEAKDPFARAHSDEVSACVEAVSRQLELEPQRSENVVFAGLLRDVGKLGITDRVLLKPGPLNADERRIVQLHPLIGARIVERVPGLADLAPAIRHHHEHWDGNGYPGGLSGEEIPLEARVLGVADTYAALTSTRPYREPVSPELACEEIKRCGGHAVRPPRRRPVREGDAPSRARRSRLRHARRVARRARGAGASESAASRCSATARLRRPTT